MAEREEEERRGGAAAVPWWGRSAGAPGWGPGSWLRAAARAMSVSPEAALLRVLVGFTVGIGGLWAAAELYGRSAAADGAPYLARLDLAAPEGSPSTGRRPPMGDYLNGMAGLWGPVLGLGEAADAVAEEASAPAEESVGAEGEGRAEDPRGTGSYDETGAGAYDDYGDGAGAGFPASAGAGAGTSAMLAAAPLASGSGAGAAAGPPAASSGGTPSSKRDMRAGALRSARAQGGRGGKGALSQLKFAERRSRLGATAGGAGSSYESAKAAFESGVPGAGAGAIGGAGASQGGAGLGSSPTPPGVTAGPLERPGRNLSCPSGYILDGESCRPLEGRNKTPYQGLADMAKTFLIAAAGLALIGLLLVTRPVPALQILGGILLGAAAGLIAAALAMGAHIERRYGQRAQKDAIDAAAGRAGQGRSP